MSQLIIITGIDGCGKSTLLNNFKSDFNSSEVITLNVPQYFTNANLPYFEETQFLEKIGKLADEQNNPFIKANASFSAMAYMSDILEYIKTDIKPKIIISERHALVDCIAYSKFYLQFLLKSNSEESIKIELSDNEKTALESINKRIQRMWNDNSMNLFNLHLKLKSVFSQDLEQLITTLSEFFKLPSPDHMIVLRLSQETIENRAKIKGSELHENVEVLNLLQSALVQTCQNYFKDSKNFHILDNNSDEDKTYQKIKDLAAL